MVLERLRTLAPEDASFGTETNSGIEVRQAFVRLFGVRCVDNDKVATSAGETAGIDLALLVVERYYGREVAQATADFMEYKGELWKNPQYGEVTSVGLWRGRWVLT